MTHTWPWGTGTLGDPHHAPLRNPAGAFRRELREEEDGRILENLAALLKVKTIVTLVVIGVFAALALAGKLQPDTVMTIVTMVVAFYFGTQSQRQNKG